MKHRKLILWLFLGASTYVVLMATTDYSKLGFCLAVGILIYLGLLKSFPSAARVWLGIGGATGAALLVGSGVFSLAWLFRDRPYVSSLFIWASLVLGIGGGILGFWVVGLLTEPPKHDTSSADENS
jgi:hypothetical protein